MQTTRRDGSVAMNQGRTARMLRSIGVFGVMLTLWGVMGDVSFGEAEAQSRGQVYVVLLGVGRYRYPRNFSTLKYTYNDLKVLQKVFIRKGRISWKNIYLLYGRKARRRYLWKVIRDLKRRVRPKDSVIVYFSGHGVSVEDMSYWLLWDTKPSDLEGTALPYMTVKGWLKSLNTERQVIFADACHSGEGMKGIRGVRGYRSVSRANPRHYKGKGRVYIASSRQSQKSLEHPTLRQGVFSYVLKQALEGKADYNQDGVVTLIEAWQHLRKHVKTLAWSLRRHRQNPVLAGTISGTISLSFPKIQQTKGQLKLRSVPKGATVYLDGVNEGVTPFTETIQTGVKKLELRMEGYLPWRQRIRIRAGRLRRLFARLRRDPSALLPRREAPARREPAPRVGAIVRIAPPPPPRTQQRRAGMLRTIKGLGGAKAAYIPGGVFWMGSPEGERGRLRREKRHKVKLSGGYWMMETEVTQGQFKALMGYNPSRFSSCGDNCPVERVNFFEAMAFANAVSKGEGLEACYVCRGRKKNVKCRLKRKFKGNGGKDYVKCGGWRLPTEAEWERAYRAGTSTAFSTGKCLSTGQANYDGRYPLKGCPKGVFRGRTTRVKSFGANPWGLYDMAGNVFEWVWDRDGVYPDGDLSVDPIQAGSHLDSGLSSGAFRVFRGGSWSYLARRARAAFRSWWRPTYRSYYVGFRLLRGDLNR